MSTFPWNRPEATKSRIKDELQTIHACKYTKLSEKEQKALEEDIVIS